MTMTDLLAIHPEAQGPANRVRVLRNSLPAARISWCPTDRPWRGWQPPAELPVDTDTSRLPGRSYGDAQPDVSHSEHMAAARTVAADTKRANGSARLSLVAALAMSMTGCMHGATTVQPTTELTTLAVGSIETTAAPAREPTTAVLVQGSDVTAVIAAVRAVGGEVTHELGIINAVGARLTPMQIGRLEASDDNLRVQADRSTSVSGESRKQSRRGRDKKKGWNEEEKRAKKISRDWEKAAEKATREATKAIREAENLADPVTLEQAKQTRLDARRWETTLKQWNKEWAKDAFLVGTKPTFFPDLVGARALHEKNITGRGVTIAILDTGLWSDEGLLLNTKGHSRMKHSYDALTDTEITAKEMLVRGNDGNGQGSHMAAVAVSSRSIDGEFNGIAPDAKLVVVNAFKDDGRGTYADVIRGLDWVLQNRERLDIRVLNLSFSASPQSAYWDDPINQAVMKLWQAGIVVVASAGNTGPAAMTIGVPGNLPYVITVGAMTDGYTPEDRSDDRLTWFTAAGPTHEGFVKPDLVAPGGHIRGVMPKRDYIPVTYPQFHDGGVYFAMSGTSQSSAVISGIVALMLQVEPELTPLNLLTSKWVEVSEPAQLARCLQPICHRVTTID